MLLARKSFSDLFTVILSILVIRRSTTCNNKLTNGSYSCVSRSLSKSNFFIRLRFHSLSAETNLTRYFNRIFDFPVLSNIRNSFFIFYYISYLIRQSIVLNNKTINQQTAGRSFINFFLNHICNDNFLLERCFIFKFTRLTLSEERTVNLCIAYNSSISWLENILTNTATI